MIRLSKGSPPTVLVKNHDNWRDEYVEHYAADRSMPSSVRYRYRHNDIKEALRQETCNKCAYCESLIAHVSPEDIEHILPKSEWPELVVEWSNLTLSCRVCNLNKLDYYSVDEPLIDPYVDEPEDHLLFLGQFVWPVPASDKGFITIHILKLDRPELVEKRTERLKHLERLVDQWKRESLPQRRAILFNEIQRFCDDCSEYAAASRSYLKAAGCMAEPDAPDLASA